MEDDVRLAPWDVVGRPHLVRIDVEDRGLGMTPDVLAHLFDRYHGSADAESVTSFVAASGAGGTHLGLHISRAIAEAHDGWLRVESNLGEGTTASVFIPEDEETSRVLSRYHYKAMPLDDAMSEKIFDRYFKSLDAEKLFAHGRGVRPRRSRRTRRSTRARRQGA